MGIAESRALWATRVQYLNDKKELRVAYEIAQSLLTEFESRHPSGISAFREYLQREPTAFIYVASFSQVDDDLSQWRAYGKPGNSYCLGFEGPAILNAAEDTGWRLAQCVYTLEEQRTTVREALEAVCAAFEGGDQSAVPMAPPVFTGGLDPIDVLYIQKYFLALLEVAPRVKNIAFQDEEEWRLISPLGVRTITHRAGPQYIIPYTDFLLPLTEGEFRITDTVVGPGAADNDAACEGVASFYRAHDVHFGPMTRPAIRPSEAPYRGW